MRACSTPGSWALWRWAGWSLLWFMCDDAFIAFRYISNRQLGWGYTWNPPPFLPVEGYTSFLWVALLDAIWTITGRQPPDTANLVGLYAALVRGDEDLEIACPDTNARTFFAAPDRPRATYLSAAEAFLRLCPSQMAANAYSAFLFLREEYIVEHYPMAYLYCQSTKYPTDCLFQ